MPSRTRKKKSEPEVLHVEGELTIFRAAELKPQLLGQPAPAAIDLSAVTEMDTAGVQLLLLAHNEALAAGRTLRLVAPSDAVSEVLALLNLVARFDIATAPAARA